MRFSGKLGFAMLSSALAFALSANAAMAGPTSNSRPLDKMRIWEGHWKFAVQVKETPYSHAGAVSWDTACTWLPHQSYMVCDYLSDGVDFEAGKVANNLSIFYYSDADKTYKHTGIGTEGGPHEQMATVDGNIWTTPFWITGHKGRKIELRNIYNFVSPGKQLYRFEASEDGGAHWTLIKEGVATKVG